MKYVAALLVGLAGTFVLGVPAQAQASRVTLNAPAAHHVGQKVVVSGKVKGGSVRSIRVEQRKAGRWALVGKAKVAHGAYRTSLKASAQKTQLRVAAAGKVSRAVVVPAAVVATDACGTVLKKADGSAWSCTFDDEFNGTTLDRSVWTPQTNFALGTPAVHACFADDPANVNVSGGSLNLTVRKVATPATCSFGGMTGPTSYVSGGVMSYRTFSQQYGRFEARIKNTATKFPGLQESFWMWPDDRVKQTTIWPYAGEIDVSETYSSYPTLSIPFLHYSADVRGNLLGVNTAWNCAAPRGVWNTYGLEWTATQLKVIVNGRTCLTNNSADTAFKKAYIMAFSQGLGAAGNVYDGRAPLGTMSIDYVKVWK